MNKSLPTIVDLLREHGPMLSGEISKLYRDMGLSESAARQRVNRRSNEVRPLFGLPFPRGARFLYLEGEFGDQRFYQSLIEKLKSAGSAYGTALSGLIARDGICLYKHWPIVSCAPGKQKGHLSHDRIIHGLKAAKLAQEIDIAGIGPCIALDDQLGSWSTSNFRAKLTIDHILRTAVRNWAIRLGWSSKGTIEMAEGDTLPRFSTMNFDIVGPCYLKSLVIRSNGAVKPGFFVCDIISSGQLQLDHVSGFLKKINTLSALRGLGRFQPMLLAEAYSEDALLELRSRGVIAATPDSLFGREVAVALEELLRVLQKSAEIAVGNPGKVEELFNKLEGFEGNLRGALFEMIVGHLVSQLCPGSIDIGVLVTNYENRQKADIDVRRVSGAEIVCYECKGHGPDVVVELEEIKYWLEKQVPIIRSAHQHEGRFGGLKERYEFWTTGKFDEGVLKYLNERKETIRKYEIDWKDGMDMQEISSSLPNKTMQRLLKRFYQKDLIS